MWGLRPCLCNTVSRAPRRQGQPLRAPRPASRVCLWVATDCPSWSEPLALHPPVWVQEDPHPAAALVNPNPASRCRPLLAAWGQCPQCPEDPATALPQLRHGSAHLLPLPGRWALPVLALLPRPESLES